MLFHKSKYRKVHENWSAFYLVRLTLRIVSVQLKQQRQYGSITNALRVLPPSWIQQCNERKRSIFFIVLQKTISRKILLNKLNLIFSALPRDTQTRTHSHPVHSCTPLHFTCVSGPLFVLFQYFFRSILLFAFGCFFFREFLCECVCLCVKECFFFFLRTLPSATPFIRSYTSEGRWGDGEDSLSCIYLSWWNFCTIFSHHFHYNACCEKRERCFFIVFSYNSHVRRLPPVFLGEDHPKTSDRSGPALSARLFGRKGRREIPELPVSKLYWIKMHKLGSTNINSIFKSEIIWTIFLFVYASSKFCRLSLHNTKRLWNYDCLNSKGILLLCTAIIIRKTFLFFECLFVVYRTWSSLS